MVAKDNSKYLFNGERYGKGRLVLAVVSAYINKHQPTIKELRETFSKDLQGSIGVFYTEQELKDRSESSNDKKIRFFTNDEDRLSTDGEQILICTEWGKGNIELFVERNSVTRIFLRKRCDQSLPFFHELLKFFDELFGSKVVDIDVKCAEANVVE